MSGKICGIIIAAAPGRMPASLRVLLRSLFPYLPIDHADNTASLMQRLAVEQPRLVLIDADLPGEAAWQTGSAIRHSPQHSVLILVHQARQLEQAGSLGLEAVLLEGMTATNLSRAISAGCQVEPNQASSTTEGTQ